jgi:hypothetical protein
MLSRRVNEWLSPVEEALNVNLVTSTELALTDSLISSKINEVDVMLKMIADTLGAIASAT